MERVGEAKLLAIQPRPFGVRRPAAVLLLHPATGGSARRLGHGVRCKPGRNCFRFRVPEALELPLVSLVVTVPTAAVDPTQTEIGLDVDGRALETVRVVISGQTRSFVSERFRAESDEIEVRLTNLEPRLLRRDLGFELFAWESSGVAGV